MAKKGVDTTFLHYVICNEDIALIETLTTNQNLAFDWVMFAQELLACIVDTSLTKISIELQIKKL